MERRLLATPVSFAAIVVSGCGPDPYLTLDAVNLSDTPVRVDYQPPLRLVHWPMTLGPQERMVFDLAPGERWRFADATPDEIAPGEYVRSPAKCWLKYQFKDKPARVIYLDWMNDLRVEFAGDQRVVFYDADGNELDCLFWWRQDETDEWGCAAGSGGLFHDASCVPCVVDDRGNIASVGM